jgi:aspartyl/asparaginyl-tRNA synthetase
MRQFTLLGINMTYQDDWHEVVDTIGSMLVFVFRALQERKQFAALIETVKMYYPSSRPFRIGLDNQGKVPRITWMEAKRILREELGCNTSNKEDFT